MCLRERVSVLSQIYQARTGGDGVCGAAQAIDTDAVTSGCRARDVQERVGLNGRLKLPRSRDLPTGTRKGREADREFA
jgi:hypothetical protein